MKKLVFLFTVLSSCFVFASNLNRVLVSSTDNIKLDTFVYNPSNETVPKGVILAIGGSGFTRAGFGGPSSFCRGFSANGFVAIDWNKRGIITSNDLKSTSVDFSVYNSATIENIFLDAASILEYAVKTYPHLPIFVVGGSEGSVTTTLLAQYYGKSIRAVATFGNVVMPFVQTASMQITDLFLKENWKKFDLDQNNEVTPSEYSGFKTEDEEFKFFMKTPFTMIDRSEDGIITFDEMSAFIVDYFVNEHPNKNYWYDSSGVANQYLESMYRLEPLTTRAYDISIPVFVAQGEIDWNTPAKNVYELEIQLKTTKKNNFRFKYYSKVGHAPSPEMFNDFLTFFDSFTTNKLK